MSVFVQATASRSRYVKSFLSGVAIFGVGALLFSGCAPAAETPGAGSQQDLTLKIGTLFPQTGGFAYVGPPEEAAVQLAVKEVNDAKLGITIELTLGDSGDTDNKAYATTTPALLNKGVSAIIGAPSSGVSKLVIDQVIGSGTILFSPGNTSPDFTTWDSRGMYFRTTPSDVLQGEVLGNLIAADGARTLGIIAVNDAYGTGLQEVTSQNFEEAGGEVVASEFFNTGDTTFTAQIAAVLAQNPDAIALLTFDEAKTIIPALKNVGFDTSKLYLVDANLQQYGTDLPAGIMTGATGTTPGRALSDDFQQQLIDSYAETNNGAVLKDFVYAPESYDAVILLALASLAAKSTVGKDIAAKLREVSGGSGNGTKVTDFASAVKIINTGGVVDYDGASGGVKFDEHGDPTEATIGIFQYDATNNFARVIE